MLNKEIEELKGKAKDLFNLTKFVKDAKDQGRLTEMLQSKYAMMKEEYRKSQFDFRKKVEQEQFDLEGKARDIVNEIYRISHNIEKNLSQNHNIKMEYENAIGSIYGLKSGVSFILKVNDKLTDEIYVEKTPKQNPYATQYFPRNLQFLHYFTMDYAEKKKQLNDLSFDQDVFEYMYVSDRKLEDAVGYKKGFIRSRIERKYDKELKKIAKGSEKVREYIKLNEYIDNNKFAYDAVNEAFEKEQKNIDSIIKMDKEVESIDLEIERNDKFAKKFMYISAECDEWMGTDATDKIENICEEWK